MTTTTTTTTALETRGSTSLTARTFLLGAEGVDGLREAVRGASDGIPGDAAAATAALRRVADDRLAEVVSGFLDVDLGAVAVTGWRRSRQLLDLARATSADPGLTSVVELLEHRTTSTWRPGVEVLLGGVRVAHLQFTLVVTFRLVGLLASVQGGRLTAVSGGRGDVHAELSLAGQRLVERRSPFDAKVHVSLGDGVPLLGRRAVGEGPVGVAAPIPRPPRQGGR